MSMMGLRTVERLVWLQQTEWVKRGRRQGVRSQTKDHSGFTGQIRVCILFLALTEFIAEL